MPWKETCAMEERLKLMLEWNEEETSVSELSRCYGVSRKTAYKWRAPYQREGVAGLLDQSRAPHRHPQGLSEVVVASVLELRHKRLTWGPKKIRPTWVGIDMRFGGRPRAASGSCCSGRVWWCRGVSVFEPRCGRPPLPHVGGPNDVWCIDLKGWFHCGDGKRCDPLTLSDAYSRYLLRCQGLKQTDVAHAWPVLEAAFRECGLPSVLRSDDGPLFGSVGAGGLSPFAVKVVKAGVLPERIDPGQSQQNGCLERLHGTVVLETTSPAASSLWAQGRRFAVSRRDYNEEQPHEALGQTPPADHYECSPRRYSGRLREPEYGADHEVRRVHHSGEIRWRGYCIYISESPAKEPVGLVKRDEGDWDIHFGPVPLGRIDRKGRFHRPKRKRRRRKPVRG